MAYYYGVTRLLGQDENVRASINRKMKSQLSVLLLSERTIYKEKNKKKRMINVYSTFAMRVLIAMSPFFFLLQTILQLYNSNYSLRDVKALKSKSP